MDIEKAKKLLNGIDIKFFLNGTIEQSNYIVDKADEINLAIETVLNELEMAEKVIDKRNEEKLELAEMNFTKSKVIDLMAEYIYNTSNREIYDKEQEIDCIKQYFYKKAEEK